MTRQPAVALVVALLGLPIASGCQPDPAPSATPSPNGADYGTNKMPPAERLAPKAGKGARSPGAPPLRR